MRTKSIFVLVSLLAVLTLTSFIDNEESSKQSDPFIVVLDAGHGGKDPGNLGNGYREKDIALNVVLKIGEELEKNKDIKVVYTRKTDVFIELYDRPKIANNADADLFVSIHCDSHTSQAYGAGTFVMSVGKISQNLRVAKQENSVIFLEDDIEKKYGNFDPNSPESLIGSSLAVEEYLDQSIIVANQIQKTLVNDLKRNDRKIKQDVFWVLHATAMPSVLVELGFLTNNAEGRYLNSTKGQNEMASAIAKAIVKYKDYIGLNVEDLALIGHMEDDDTQEEIQAVVNPDIEFKVQIAASSRDLITKPYNFKGLEGVTKANEDGLYKYYYGLTSDYNVIKTLEQEAKSKGYKTSFIVAFKKGEQIPLSEALKSTAN